MSDGFFIHVCLFARPMGTLIMTTTTAHSKTKRKPRSSIGAGVTPVPQALARLASRKRLRQLMCSASIAAFALGAQGARAQTSVISGSVHTTVAEGASGKVVTTTNIDASQQTAFNRFSTFTVAEANLVTLVLPTNTHNLVNVVDSRVTIDGTVTSRLHNETGTVGGNLYFVTSGGMMVGAKGSVNTGRLIVRGGDANGALPNVDDTAHRVQVGSLIDYGSTDAVTINGKVNAPGGIDIKARSFTLGATGALSTGQAGNGAIGVMDGGRQVSTAGLVEGARLVKVDGGIAIVGADAVTLAGGSTLDARASSVGNPAVPLPGGIDIASSGTVSLAGTLTAWDGTAQGTASDIMIATSRTAIADTSFGSMLMDAYWKALAATTGIDVTGAITGGKVTLKSAATSATDDSFDMKTTTIDTLVGIAANAALSSFGLAADVIVTRTDANSHVTVGAGSTVTAKGDVSITADSVSAAKGSAVAMSQNATQDLSIAIGVSQVESKANVIVGGTVTAGGALTLGATNDARSELKLLAISTGTAKAGAAAYTQANVDATVDVLSGAKLDGSSVSLHALNHQTPATNGTERGWENTATVFAKDDSEGGGTAAVSDLNVTSSVRMAGAIGSVTRPGTVTIDAKSVTALTLNYANSSTGSGPVTNAKAMKAYAGTATVSDAAGSFAGKFAETVLGKEEAETPDEADTKDVKRFGAAVSVLFNESSAVATVNGSISATGAVAVDTLVNDKTVRNNAKASTSASKKIDGNATSVAGAASWSTSGYTSNALVGGTIVAGSLAVTASTDRPRGENYDFDTDLGPENGENASTAWAKDLMGDVKLVLSPEKGFFANSAGATAKTESAKNAAISGSVSYADIVADTQARITPLAQLTLGGALDVDATSTITMLNLSGAIPITGAGFATSSGSTAAGAVVTFSDVAANTIASIGKDVTLDRAANATGIDTQVNATSDIDLITLAPQAGKSNSKSGSGTFASNTVEGTTLATISKDARLDLGTGKLTLAALTRMELWAVGGSIAYTKADGTGDSKTAGSIGVAGALNFVDFDTRARVTSDGDALGTAPAATPGITAGAVAITADTTGSINALSVAGAITDTSPAQKKDDGTTETADKPKGTGQKAKTALRTAAGLVKAPFNASRGDYVAFATKYAGDLDKAETEQNNADAVKHNDAIDKGTPVTKGFGAAGSASVNLSSLTTRVETAGARFIRAAGAPATPSSLVIKATEGVDLLAATGAAAIVKGTAKTSGNSLISGAYGLSSTGNVTSALVTDTVATGFNDVTVQALTNGVRISAGLAISVDATTDENSKMIAGSVSHLIANDGASATVSDSSLTGNGTTTGKVDVLAYNGLSLAAGAGGVAAGKGKGAGGSATVIQVGSPADGAAGATLLRTDVVDFDGLSVRGLTGARIIGAAVAGAISTGAKGKALSAALSLNLVSFDSVALIDTGANGQGRISVGGAVNVFGGDLAEGDTVVTRDPATAGPATGMLADFKLGGSDFSGDDPFQAAELTGGTQILSIAMPISGAKGGSAGGVGFAWNSIDNDRTVGIIGGGIAGTPTITARTVSVQAVDHSDILAIGVGVGAAGNGSGFMGSVARNLIEGSSSAVLGRSTINGTDLSLNVTGPVGTTPNVSVGAAADGGIWSLAGAVGFAKGAAAGLSVGVNDITRTVSTGTGGLADAPSDAGLHAAIAGVTFDGTPDVTVNAVTGSRITAYGIAAAASTQSAAVAGAATANQIAPTIAASASGLTYLTASPGDLKVRANDQSSILSTALVLGVSAKTGSVAAGISVNRIDTDVSASLSVAATDRVRVRNLLIDTSSIAATRAFGLGAAGGKSVGVAGSIAVNLTTSDVSSLLRYDGGEITTTGSIGVVAKRDLTIDVGAGAIGIAAQGAGIGASVIVNTLGGSADAKIVGAGSGTINAFTGSDSAASALTGLRTGELTTSLPQFDGLDGFKDLALKSMIDPRTADFKGVAVNASSTAATRTIAISGGIAGTGAGIGVTGVVDTTTGTTNASVENANITVGGASASESLGLDVRASSQQVGVTFAGAIAGSGSVAVSAPIVSDSYTGTTSAAITGGRLNSAGGIAVNAIGNQSSTALAAAGAIGGSAAAAVAGVSPRFESKTTAAITTPTELVALGNRGVAVNANSLSRALATFVTVAGAGSGAVAGAVVVATNENQTSATYTGTRDANTQLANGLVTAKAVAVDATSGFSATVAGASAAAAANAAIVGNGVGVVHRGTTIATADALKYDNTGGTVSVKAIENVAVATVVGQVALAVSPVSAGASLGAIAILAQSKVDATISRPSILNASSVTVDAKGYNQINALQLGVAIGGVGIGANVTYIGIGKVGDTGALTATAGDGDADQKVATSTGSTGTGNSNLTQLQNGGSTTASGIAGQTGTVTTDDDRAALAQAPGAHAAFGSVKAPGDDSTALVRAQVIGGSGSGNGQFEINATDLTVDSAANLRSKSTNVQLTAGIAGAGSATVGITRNAAQSVAQIGTVTATGQTLKVNANTGEAQGTLSISLPGADAPTHAAEANIKAGTVGIGALSVGVADAKLTSSASASSDGNIDFNEATIKANDTTTAQTDALGVVAGAAAINVVISRASKDGTVAATVSNTAAADTLKIIAEAMGGASADATAGSGGVLFAGNAAVALASDTRTVSATVAENSRIFANTTVHATSTPLVTARSIGVAVSGGVAAGASLATASSSGLVKAKVGERGVISGSLDILAETLLAAGGRNVSATAIGSSGGYLAAVNGSMATATTDLTTEAALGADLGTGNTGDAAVEQIGTLTVKATRATGQYSEATGVTFAGGFAAGIQKAESDSSGTTRATLGNVDGSGRNLASDVTILSDVHDRNQAKVVAGAGGIATALASSAETNSNGHALTEVLTPSAKTFLAGNFTATSQTAADYQADSDSTLATIAGGSGTSSTNRVGASATTNIGKAIGSTSGTGSTLRAASFHIGALNEVAKGNGGTARGAGGGVITGQAAQIHNVLNQVATVNLRDGLTLRQSGYATADGVKANTRATFIDAATTTDHTHAATLDVGGAMQLPFAQAGGSYNATNAINVGRNILIRGDQGIGLGTTVTQNIIDTTAVQIYGLASIGGGKTDSTSNVHQAITMADGSMIESLMDIRVSAGTAADGVLSDNLRIITQTDTFNWTALPLSTEASAVSRINAHNMLNLGASTIRSGRDLIISAMPSAAQPSASGTGHNPYLALFGMTNGSGNTSSATSGSITLDGATLTAGYLSDRKIDVDASGNVTMVDAGDPNNADPDRLGGFLVTQGTFGTLAYLNTQIDALKTKVVAAGLAAPEDPGTAADPTAAREALNTAASSSDLIAQLGALYETRVALKAASGQAANGTGGENSSNGAIVFGGMLSGSMLTGVGGIFAAGGVVNLNTDRLTQGARTGTVTANGGGKVTITNLSRKDTIVGDIFVPMKSAGVITFAGKANSLSGIATPVVPSGTGAGAGQVRVETGEGRSDIIALGTVTNLGGAFSALTKAGNYVQFGAVDVASFSADAPQGLFSVSTPNGTFSQGQPLNYYYGNFGISLYGSTTQTNPQYSTSSGQASLSANEVSNFLATWAAKRRLGLFNEVADLAKAKAEYREIFKKDAGDLMYDMFIAEGNNYTSSTGGSGSALDTADTGGTKAHRGIVVWSSCNTTCEWFSNDSPGSAGTLVGLGFDGNSGSAFPDYYFFTTPTPTYNDTVIVANPVVGGTNSLSNTYPGLASPTDNKNAITATNVFITAKTVDVSGTIVAGPNKVRSLLINNLVDGDINQFGFQSAAFGTAMAQGSDATIDLTKTVNQFGAAASGNIGAQFIRTGIGTDGQAQGYIQVDDVSAGLGGTITISGKILNTNPLGTAKLKVLSGYGTINLTNQTPYEIKVGTLNAGVDVTGRITLRDAGTTTEYSSASGSNAVTIKTYVNGGAPVTTYSSAGLSDSGPALKYNPTGRYYYVWTDSRTIHRTIAYPDNALWLATVTPWSFADGGTAPNAGYYVNLDTVGSSAGARANEALNGSNANYVQVAYGSDVDADISGTKFSGEWFHSWDVPYQATLNTETAVKATYPIRIVFDQGGIGGLNVVSSGGGNITLTGALTYGGGAVSLDASRGAIGAEAGGLVTARDIDLKANSGIGSITGNAPFRANLMGGTVSATSYAGDVNLELKSVASAGGTIAPITINSISALGNVRVGADASLVGQAGTAANITSSGNITLESGGRITGASYDGATNLPSQGLRIRLLDTGILNVTAGGDVAIEQVVTSGTSQTLRVGSITTSGDVLLKAPGSIVAADATATVDQEKLARFLSAAKSLQLAPVTDCVAPCVFDPSTLGAVDQALRTQAYAAYDKLTSTAPGEAAAAAATLTKLFGVVPAARGAIATAGILRAPKIEYQLRIQASDAFDRYALTNPAATAEDSRGAAVTQTLATIGQVNALLTRGQGVIELTSNGSAVRITDASAASLSAGGDLYQLALATLAAKNQGPVGGVAPTLDQLRDGLQLYLDDLRAPVASLFPTVLPDLGTLDAAAQAAELSRQIDPGALAAWVTARNLATQRAQATTEALGKVEQIKAFQANAGLSVSADGRTVTVTDFTQDALKAGGQLYELALATLRSATHASGLQETLPLPSNADISRGLQVYLNSLRSPLNALLPDALPTLSGTDALQWRTMVSAAISDGNLATWAGAIQATAVNDLTKLFGTVPVSRATIATAAFDATMLAKRLTGNEWTQTMLDVAVPSTAFVPVADTQFETRKPVITARGVTLLAGNSIGAFDAQQTFTYTAAGLVSSLQGNALEAQKSLAAAYLASAGPGDLTLAIVRDASGQVSEANVTTRREQPLQLNASGIVNAVAGVSYATMAPTMVSASSTVLGNIFLNNANTLILGSIVSEKWKTGASTAGCNIGIPAASACDSRIRIVAPDIIGAVSGAAQVFAQLGTVSNRLSNADGSALVMGGLVRMEASTGSIKGETGGSIAVDTAALEVLRAAGDISIARRVTSALIPTIGGGGYRNSNDLLVGDIFAGNRLQLDNYAGSMFVVRLPSVLESENRNSRIVANVLAIRAAGDIGSASVDGTGLVGQFDLQTPVIDQFVAGFDYATGKVGVGAVPAGMGTGSGYFALRGVVQVGLDAGSLLGARKDIVVGTLNLNEGVADPIASSLTFKSNIFVGGDLILSTDGEVSFPDPDILITAPGFDVRPDVVNLSKLRLTMTGKFNYFNTRSIILGSISTGGGLIESSNGSVTVNGALYGNGGPETPLTLRGKTGVTVGSTGFGAISLLSSDGDVRVTGQARASDLTIAGVNVSIASGIYGRSASITAMPTGTIDIGGSVLLQRDSSRPDIAANFTMTGGVLSVAGKVSAQDAVRIAGQSITAQTGATFTNTQTLSLIASGTLSIDPSVTMSGIGDAILTAGSGSITLPDFGGRSLLVTAPGGIYGRTIYATGDAILTTDDGVITLGNVTTGGAFSATGRTIGFANGASIRDSASLTLQASDAISATTGTNITTRGLALISARDAITLGTVRVGYGSIFASSGNLTFGNALTTTIGALDLSSGGTVSFGNAVNLMGALSVNADAGIAFLNAVTMNGPANSGGIELITPGAVTFSKSARIVGKTQSASVLINAGSVSMDPLASITGASVALNAKTGAVLGDIRALDTQTVSLRSNGANSVGTVTGGGTTITATGGALTLRGTVKAGALTLSARDDVTTAGITATSATILSSAGSVALKGTTRIVRSDAPTTARLSVTAAKAITMEGATSAGGGITLTGSALSTINGGYITDVDQLGALTTLRADTMTIRFDTGNVMSGVPLRIDARGRTASSIADAAFSFGTLRPITFDALWLMRGALSATTALTVTSLTMRDFLTLSLPNGTVALQGAGVAPAAMRSVNTGALSAAKLAVTLPVSGGAPVVSINGTSR